MNFANVKCITIPEGAVKALSIGGVKVWSAVTVDKYSWEAVFASIDAGTYATDYAIGDCVPLDLGSEGVINMQIAAFDTDDLADGSGKAKITWIAKELLATSKPMGSGNWESCSMRSYLKNTIKPLIPDAVRSRICEISKVRNDYSSGSLVKTTFVDDVWLPYRDDIYPSNGLYNKLYSSTAVSVKKKVGETATSDWWTSTQKTSSEWMYSNAVNGVASANSDSYSTSYGVCLCFCTN